MRNCVLKENRKHFSGLGSKFKTATWGFGLTFLHDEAGTLSVKDNANLDRLPLYRNQVMASASLHKPLNDRTFLNVGFRVGGIFQTIETNHLTFDEQFDGLAGFNSAIAGEFDNMDALNNNMLDFGAGVSFAHLGKNRGIILGAAIDHILIPAEFNFIEDDNALTLSRKFAAHFKVSSTFKQNMKNPFGLNFKGIFLHQNSFQQIIGGVDLFYQATYKNNKNFTITLGGSLRSSRTFNGRNIESAIVGFTINFEHYSFGFNYDINRSQLIKVSNSYGALEFSMIYRWKKKNSGCRPPLVGCPDKNTVHAIFF